MASEDRRIALRRRPALTARMASAIVAACWALAACTAAGGGAPPSPGTPASSSAIEMSPRPGAGGSSTADTARAEPAPQSAPTEPGPRMTSIEEASECSVRRPLTGPSRVVTVDQVFPESPTVGFSDPSETVPGADTGNPARCPGELPPGPHCDEPLPWTGLLGDGFLAASGARRIVDGYLLSMPKGTASDAPPENTPGTRVVTYRLLDLAPDDPKALGAYLDRTFRVCAKARPATIGGVAAVIGTGPSETHAASSRVALLRRGSHLVWAVLDGTGWKQGEQQRALQALAAHLL